MQLLKAVMLSGVCSLLTFTLTAQRVTPISPRPVLKHPSSSSKSFSRRATTYVPPEVPGKGFYLSLAPLSLIDPIEPSVNLHFMYATGDKLAFGMEAGYIYHYPEAGDLANGFRLRPEVRFKNILKAGRMDSPWYLSVQGMFKQTTQPFDYDELVVLSPTVSFTRFHSTRLRRTVTGLNALIGKELFLSRESKHLFVDIYAGMGFRYRVVRLDDGASREIIEDFNNGDWLRIRKIRNTDGAGLSLLLGLRAGWKF
ncbi:hypothetical protein [Filimonas effusa]|uniref:DUF3575 domain-containing protein n=1 Tax=Filimonas effusa TaxID=2508721 RepID=A0A4Q1DAX9_9BACT|nr:hypothetical protein [Filimonas effusa]RXK85925.1 hypothetical protein ESB13_03695 [Filimonas effusa]